MADSTTEHSETINEIVDDLVADYCKQNQSILPREFRSRLHKLFSRIEQEFEREYQKVYAENLSYQERLEKLEDPDHFDVNNIVKRSASQLSQRIKQQYKQSTSKLVSSLRQTTISSAADQTASDTNNNYGGPTSLLNKTLHPLNINAIGASQNNTRCINQFISKLTTQKDGVWEVKGFKNFIASCSADSTVKLWSNYTPTKCMLTYTGHTGSVNSVRFREHDHLMLTSSGDGSAHLIRLPTQHLQTAQQAAILNNHQEYISAMEAASLAINSDVSGSCQNQFIHTNCVNLDSLDEIDHQTILESPIKSANLNTSSNHNNSLNVKHPRMIYQSVNLNDSSYYAISKDNLAKGNVQMDSSPLEAADFITSRDQIVTAGWDRIGRIYDLSTGQEVSSLSGHDDQLTDVRCAPNGEDVILTSSKDGTFRIWDLRSQRAEMHVQEAHTNCVSSAQFVPGYSLHHIVSGGRDKFCRFWDIRSNPTLFSIRLSSQVYRFDISHGSPKLTQFKAQSNGGQKNNNCENDVQNYSSFNSKMNVIALPLENREIRFIDMVGTRIGRLTRNQNFNHSRIITSTAWASEGKSNFFASSFDNSISMWNVTFTC